MSKSNPFITTSGASATSPAPTSFNPSLSIKLDDQNLLLWKQQVEAVIIAHKLHRYVVNPMIPPQFTSESNRALGIESEAYQLWVVQDHLLFTWLLGSLSPSILPRFIGCKQSWQVWEKIHKQFHVHLRTKVRQFRSELKNMKKGSRTISEYLLQIRALIESLHAIGDPVTDQDHIDTILDGLPEEYNSLVMMIYVKGDSSTVDDSDALLLMQDAQFEKFRQELPSPSISVNVAQASSLQESFSANDFN